VKNYKHVNRTIRKAKAPTHTHTHTQAKIRKYSLIQFAQRERNKVEYNDAETRPF